MLACVSAMLRVTYRILVTRRILAVTDTCDEGLLPEIYHL